MPEAAKIELAIKEDINRMLLKLKDVPDFKFLRGIGAAYEDGNLKYIDKGLMDEKESINYEMVGLVILKEALRRVTKGGQGTYDNDMLNSYFVSDEETGADKTFGRY